mgnify:CR=1 FL=1
MLLAPAGDAVVAEAGLPPFPPRNAAVVVFDVVGTLVEPWPSVPEAYALAAAAHGLVARPEDLSRRFAAAWRRQEGIDAVASPPFATSRAREVDRWRGIVHDVFEATAPADVREAVFRDLWDHFARPASWRPLERGTRLLHSALEAGCGVALASNFDERLIALAARLEPLSLAGEVFASSELGWRKPAPGFFRAVEARLQRRPHELLLVGDDPRLDVEAASAAGWRALAVA